MQPYLQVNSDKDSRSFNAVDYSTMTATEQYKCLTLDVAESGVASVYLTSKG